MFADILCENQRCVSIFQMKEHHVLFGLAVIKMAHAYSIWNFDENEISQTAGVNGKLGNTQKESGTKRITL